MQPVFQLLPLSVCIHWLSLLRSDSSFPNVEQGWLSPTIIIHYCQPKNRKKQSERGTQVQLDQMDQKWLSVSGSRK